MINNKYKSFLNLASKYQFTNKLGTTTMTIDKR